MCLSTRIFKNKNSSHCLGATVVLKYASSYTEGLREVCHCHPSCSEGYLQGCSAFPSSAFPPLLSYLAPCYSRITGPPAFACGSPLPAMFLFNTLTIVVIPFSTRMSPPPSSFHDHPTKPSETTSIWYLALPFLCGGHACNGCAYLLLKGLDRHSYTVWGFLLD